MKDAFRIIVHLLIGLLLGLQLINVSVDTSRRLSYALRSSPQIHAASENNRLEAFAALLLGIDLETDNSSPENDESETDQEPYEGLDFLHTHSDAIRLCPVLSSDNRSLNHPFDAHLESIALDTISPPPKS